MKRFCYIDFKSNSSISAALKVVMVGGRKVFVDYETGQAKAGFHYG
jgi:hypothetical protein